MNWPTSGASIGLSALHLVPNQYVVLCIPMKIERTSHLSCQGRLVTLAYGSP